VEQVLGMHASAHEALVRVLASTVEQVFRSGRDAGFPD
jgi:hypothetical protein